MENTHSRTRRENHRSLAHTRAYTQIVQSIVWYTLLQIFTHIQTHINQQSQNQVLKVASMASSVQSGYSVREGAGTGRVSRGTVASTDQRQSLMISDGPVG